MERRDWTNSSDFVTTFYIQFTKYGKLILVNSFIFNNNYERKALHRQTRQGWSKVNTFAFFQIELIQLIWNCLPIYRTFLITVQAQIKKFMQENEQFVKFDKVLNRLTTA